MEMKEVISNLFKEEGEEVEMNRIDRKDKQRNEERKSQI